MTIKEIVGFEDKFYKFSELSFATWVSKRGTISHIKKLLIKVCTKKNYSQICHESTTPKVFP
jgi:hypothetical protein